MKYGRDRKQQRLDSQDHYKELEESCNEKASREFHRIPYQSYTVDDYLKKMGVDITKGVEND